VKSKLPILIVFGLCLLSACFWIEKMRRAKKLRNSETFLLQSIEIEVVNRLGEGQALPTNWFDLTNSIRLQSLLKFSNTLSGYSPAEVYKVLPHAVAFTFYNRTSSAFLVRSEPCSWPSRPPGRWILSATDSQVYRTWVDEDKLPLAIKSQLTNSSQ
jgi:hypothetical protein